MCCGVLVSKGVCLAWTHVPVHRERKRDEGLWWSRQLLRAHRWPVSTRRHSLLQTWDFIPHNGCFIIVLCCEDSSPRFTAWSATIWHLLPEAILQNKRVSALQEGSHYRFKCEFKWTQIEETKALQLTNCLVWLRLKVPVETVLEHHIDFEGLVGRVYHLVSTKSIWEYSANVNKMQGCN